MKMARIHSNGLCAILGRLCTIQHVFFIHSDFSFNAIQWIFHSNCQFFPTISSLILFFSVPFCSSLFSFDCKIILRFIFSLFSEHWLQNDRHRLSFCHHLNLHFVFRFILFGFCLLALFSKQSLGMHFFRSAHSVGLRAFAFDST